MVKAQEKGDQKLAATYGDSAMAMMDPSCIVKQPKQPDDYYDAQREHRQPRGGAGDQGLGMSRSELAMAKERARTILQGADAARRRVREREERGEQPRRRAQAAAGHPGAAPGPRRQARARAAAAPAPAAAAAPQDVGRPVEAMANCMASNAQKHEKEIEALGNARPGRGGRRTTWRR